MCGIAGSSWVTPPSGLEQIVQNQVRLLHHRGPDDWGSTWFDSGAVNALLLQTRLSIIDLSPAGHQPRSSKDGRYEIVFNGEIYNYIELRDELKVQGVEFFTDTDTEVLLNAWIRWGKSCLRSLTGMFAFAVLDKQLKTITLVRDAFGIKPLFYRDSMKQFSFSSELGSLLNLDPSEISLNWQQCYEYLVHGRYDSDSNTFLNEVQHLLPAHFIVFDLRTRTIGQQQRWWSPIVDLNDEIDFDSAVGKFRQMLTDSVRLHLRSDVPIGAALSGGLDSSTITSLIREIEPNTDLNTFSYIAANSIYDEEQWVNIVNKQTEATPHKIFTNPEELDAHLPALTALQGEPYGSTSIYVQYATYRRAHESGIVVMLDGQGADELLGGYLGFPGARMLTLWEKREYFKLLRFARRWKQRPNRNRGAQWKAFIEYLTPKRLRRIATRLVGRDSIPDWLNGEVLSQLGVNLDRPNPGRSPKFAKRRLTEALIGSLERLPSLLRHADRNAMHFSIESRVPFLTIEIAEFLLSLPEEFLIDDETGTKLILRAAGQGLVPDEILDRKDKIGFASPEESWMRSDPTRIDGWVSGLEPVSDYLNLTVIQHRWDSFHEGKEPWDPVFWRWESFGRWLSQLPAGSLNN